MRAGVAWSRDAIATGRCVTTPHGQENRWLRTRTRFSSCGRPHRGRHGASGAREGFVALRHDRILELGTVETLSKHPPRVGPAPGISRLHDPPRVRRLAQPPDLQRRPGPVEGSPGRDRRAPDPSRRRQRARSPARGRDDRTRPRRARPHHARPPRRPGLRADPGPRLRCRPANHQPRRALPLPRRGRPGCRAGDRPRGGVDRGGCRRHQGHGDGRQHDPDLGPAAGPVLGRRAAGDRPGRGGGWPEGLGARAWGRGHARRRRCGRPQHRARADGGRPRRVAVRRELARVMADKGITAAVTMAASHRAFQRQASGGAVGLRAGAIPIPVRQENARRLREAGVRVVVGTDAGAALARFD